MTNAQKIALRLSEVRQRLNEIAGLDDLTDAVRTEAGNLQTEYADLEIRHRAAITAEAADAEQRAAQFEGAPDAEQRERLELRAKARVGAFLAAALQGRLPSGAEAELAAAAGAEAGQIPMELWEKRADQTSNAPSTVGINMQPLLPMIFAQSIATKLMIDMPRAPGGTWAQATISTSLTAGAKAKGDAAEATAAALTVSSASPKRISARMAVRIEDVASIGTANFEAALRSNMSMALSAELDDQIINGTGTAPNVNGLLNQLTDPADPSAVSTFDDFVSAFTGQIDGLWATDARQIAIVCGVDTFKLSARTFRDATGQHLGAQAFSDYAAAHFGGWTTNARMPAASSTIQAAIVCKKGRPGMRIATCPTWGGVGVDDIYSGSASGVRYFTLHTLIGDVILNQPGAFARADFKVS